MSEVSESLIQKIEGYARLKCCASGLRSPAGIGSKSREEWSALFEKADAHDTQAEQLLVEIQHAISEMENTLANNLRDREMKKEEILQNVIAVFDQKYLDEVYKDMRVKESAYNEYHLVGSCFTLAELSAMSEDELNNLVKIAGYAAEALF